MIYIDRHIGGRRHVADSRDWAYRMAPHTKPLGCFGRVVVPVIGHSWPIGPILDQGATPQCVAYAWADWLSCQPITTLVDTPSYEDWFYRAAQVVDEWPGTDYDGTSVRAGARIMQQQGHIGGYVWASSEPEIWNYISSSGPVVMGSNWYSGMFAPDPGGYLNLTGPVVGGHAYLLYESKGDYAMQNSWGADWGLTGTARLRRSDVARLLGEDGEACAGLELGL